MTCPSPPNDDCQDAEPICRNVCTHPTANTLSSRWSCETTADCPAPDECLPLAPDPDNGYCVNNDILDDGPICSVSAQDCYDGSECRGCPFDAYRCRVATDNRLATTDGRVWGDDCFPPVVVSFGADVWYEITAPCSGVLVVSMCNAQSQYDSMLAVYGNHTPSSSCQGIANEDALYCNDDFCPGAATVSGVQTLAFYKGAYLVRVGGYSPNASPEHAEQGISELDIGFVCGPADAPLLPASPEHQAPKNRYLSIDPHNGRSVALAVFLDSMRRCAGDDRRACRVDGDCPNVCDNTNNLQCVDDDICAGGTCVPTAPCVQHADVDNVIKYVDTPYTSSCSPLDDCADQWFAHLNDAPVYRMWTEDTIHITDCEIVPAAVYEIRGTPDGTSFGGGLTIGTITKPNVHYGDCVGPVVGDEFTPPDGFTSVVDVQAYLIANQGGANAPHTTWVDLQGLSATRICDPPDGGCVVPQQVLNVSDLQTIKFGFLGQTYVETPGHENPGDCP